MLFLVILTVFVMLMCVLIRFEIVFAINAVNILFTSYSVFVAACARYKSLTRSPSHAPFHIIENE